MKFDMKNKNIFLKGALCGALTMLLIAGLVSCGISVKSGDKKALGSETQNKLNKLESIIDSYYLGDVDEENMQEGIYAGYVEGLGDPYSVYYNEEETALFKESTQGEYKGIGAVLSQNKETGIITFIQIYDDSPAQKAGLRDGDILYLVNGEEVTGIDLTKVVMDIKGEKGTEVELTVLRGDSDEEITVTSVRDTIEYPTVYSKMLEEQVGYIQITEFDSVTYDQYMEAWNSLEAQGVKGLVVDLRNNPGGSLTVVCDILDEILPEGKIVYTEDKNGKQQEMLSDEEHKLEVPLTVLVNQYSASASEIFAGAVQDYGIGKIVGTTTYGKGVVQQVFDLKDGTCMKLTISEYFTPKGRNINKKGIEPDVEVKYEYNESDEEADNQLEKAIEVLKNEM